MQLENKLDKSIQWYQQLKLKHLTEYHKDSRTLFRQQTEFEITLKSGENTKGTRLQTL